MRLCRDPLGELERSPDSLVAIGKRSYILRGRETEGDGGEKREGKRRDCLLFI